MKEFIYSIYDVFSNDKLLQILDSTSFFIASYQRGYKWKSVSKNDQVPLLLTDTYEAYKNANNEYFLQYITIKKSSEKAGVLEVIDGQQRLTTLSLIFYVYEGISLENIAKDKVQYQRYINRNVFNEILDIKADDEKLNKHQDLYYLFHAKECILKFFKSLGEELQDYIEYLKHNVKLIVNLEDELTTPEEIFSNLNDNSVSLTNFYLIKGLLFTKGTREDNGKKSFIEVQEQRNRIARNWDLYNSWFMDEAQNQLFFSNMDLENPTEANIGINSILNLAKPQTNTKDVHDNIRGFYETLQLEEKDKNIFHLFNMYNEGISNSAEAKIKLEEIEKLCKRLINWYQDPELYHLIGFYICTNGSIWNIKDCGSKALKKLLYKHLYEAIKLKKSQLKDLNYSDHRPKLNKIFLAINSFPIVIENEISRLNFSTLFNFNKIRNNNWTIEHIYPQNIDFSVEDIKEYKSWFLFKSKGNEEITSLLNDCYESDYNLNEDDINKIKDVVLNKDIKEHQIGNLSLIEAGNNSKLKNYIFPKKRKILLDLVSKGKFVPTHTINVVAKLLFVPSSNDQASFGLNMEAWEVEDCKANYKWLKYTYEELLKIVESKIEVKG